MINLTLEQAYELYEEGKIVYCYKGKYYITEEQWLKDTVVNFL